MKTRYDEPSIRISIIITDREHIFRWGRTHPSHERFSRRKWERSWGYRRSVDCITATNDGLPEKPQSTRLRAASPGALKSVSGTVLPCTLLRRTSFAGLKRGRKLLRLCSSSPGMACEVGCTEFSLGTDPIPFSTKACGQDGNDVETTDPARAMVTGKIADVACSSRRFCAVLRRARRTSMRVSPLRSMTSSIFITLDST